MTEHFILTSDEEVKKQFSKKMAPGRPLTLLFLHRSRRSCDCGCICVPWSRDRDSGGAGGLHYCWLNSCHDINTSLRSDGMCCDTMWKTDKAWGWRIIPSEIDLHYARATAICRGGEHIEKLRERERERRADHLDQYLKDRGSNIQHSRNFWVGLHCEEIKKSSFKALTPEIEQNQSQYNTTQHNTTKACPNTISQKTELNFSGGKKVELSYVSGVFCVVFASTSLIIRPNGGEKGSNKHKKTTPRSTKRQSSFRVTGGLTIWEHSIISYCSRENNLIGQGWFWARDID